MGKRLVLWGLIFALVFVMWGCGTSGSGGSSVRPGASPSLASHDLPPPPPQPQEIPAADLAQNSNKINFSQAAVQIPLSAGWNTISFPFKSVTSSSGFTYYLYKYNGISYERVNPVANPGSIDCHCGYWAYAAAATEVTVDGLANEAPDQITDINLAVGWNLVGFPFGSSKTFGSVYIVKDGTTKTLAEAVTAGWIRNSIFEWNSGGWLTQSASSGSGAFASKKGYWIRSLEICQLRYQYTGAAIVCAGKVSDPGGNPVSGALVHVTKGFSDKVTLTDADGYWSFYGLESGPYSLEILKPDYAASTGSLTLPTSGVKNSTLTPNTGKPTISSFTLNSSASTGDTVTFTASGSVADGVTIAKVMAVSLDLGQTFTLDTTGNFNGTLNVTVDGKWKPGTCVFRLYAVNSAGGVEDSSDVQITIAYPAPNPPAQAELIAQKAVRMLNGLQEATSQQIYNTFDQAYQLDSNNALANTGIWLLKDMPELADFYAEHFSVMERSSGIAVYANYLYVSDYGNHRLQIFNLSNGGFIGWFGKDETGSVGWHGPGSGRKGRMGSEPGAFSGPAGIAVSGSNIYVVDTGNHRVQKFILNGSSVSFAASWGHYSKGNDGFRRPCGVAVLGNAVYVTDYFNHRIVKLQDNGETMSFVEAIGGAGRGDGEFNGPRGIASYDNQLYVADYDNSRVQVFSAAGVYERQFPAEHPESIAVNPANGDICVTFSGVATYHNNGTLVSIFYYPGHWQMFGDYGWWVYDGSGYGTQHQGVVFAPEGSLLVFTGLSIQGFLFDAVHYPYWSYVSSFGSYGDGDSQFKKPSSDFSRYTGLNTEVVSPKGLYDFAPAAFKFPMTKDSVELTSASASAYLNQLTALIEKQIRRCRAIELYGGDNYDFPVNRHVLDSLCDFNGQPLTQSALNPDKPPIYYLNAAAIYGFDGAFSNAVSWLYFVSAYSYENVENHIDDHTAFGEDVDHDGLISLSTREGFPSDVSNAFKLAAQADQYTGKTGAEHIQSAYQYQKDFVAKTLRAKDMVMALSSSEFLLTPKPDPNLPAFIDTVEYLNSYQQALEGSNTVHFPYKGLTYNINCNFKAWYEWLAGHPDIMVLSPTLNASDRSLNSWPDGTLGGLLPNGMGGLPPDWRGTP